MTEAAIKNMYTSLIRNWLNTFSKSFETQFWRNTWFFSGYQYTTPCWRIDEVPQRWTDGRVVHKNSLVLWRQIQKTRGLLWSLQTCCNVRQCKQCYYSIQINGCFLFVDEIHAIQRLKFSNYIKRKEFEHWSHDARSYIYCIIAL